MNTKTPETDKAMKYWPSEHSELVDANFARKLEIEKNELKQELNAWKDKLKLIGDSPEAVWESWRKRQIKMFKYQREAIILREKYKKDA